MLAIVNVSVEFSFQALEPHYMTCPCTKSLSGATVGHKNSTSHLYMENKVPEDRMRGMDVSAIICQESREYSEIQDSVKVTGTKPFIDSAIDRKIS